MGSPADGHIKQHRLCRQVQQATVMSKNLGLLTYFQVILPTLFEEIQMLSYLATVSNGSFNNMMKHWNIVWGLVMGQEERWLPMKSPHRNSNFTFPQIWALKVFTHNPWLPCFLRSLAGHPSHLPGSILPSRLCPAAFTPWNAFLETTLLPHHLDRNLEHAGSLTSWVQTPDSSLTCVVVWLQTS